jgi:hypothetical protein
MKRSNSMTEIQAFAKKAFPKKPRAKKLNQVNGH